MKKRIGFVGNSSSSSFVVHKFVIGEDNFKKLIAGLEEFRLGIKKPFKDYKPGDCWGDSGLTYQEENDYLLIETYCISNSEFYDLTTECGINGTNVFHIEY